MTKVLIVDDDESARYMMRLILQKHVSEIREAPNAPTALQSIKADKPDIIIFDIVMPGAINGIEACEMVKSDPQTADCYVVIISGKTGEHDFGEARRAGANAYFVKPFRFHRLVEVIEKHRELSSEFLLEKYYS
jgi:CheY-like chemotaxis protein